MGKALIAIVGVVLLVYAFFDLIATPRSQVRGLPKAAWFVAILVPFVGPLAWVFLGSQPRKGRPPRDSGYGWPGGRPPTRGPDDDPDYLRGL
ncbi:MULTISPECIES: PLD nuclease N-terminal domain-containing protein [unclassified Aeromicrobium]|uniref:PLD nuclease N-terminal domain-containing protein n=1 Tax=unclassified Aeromicrobium TaxID=2633570 RepID=UPI0006FD4AFC|nr:MULTISPECIES: PLD nuclease N-terminal domain-containing protein [unclassified Aeromicrobium]KQP84379.1 hypothetical protein ASF35_05570 [Aeromicrobium sp. Leaf291]